MDNFDQLLDHIHLLDNRDLFSQLPDESVDLVLTDPPYKNYRSNRPVAHEKMKKVAAEQFDLPLFARESFRVLKTGGHLYCWCDHITYPAIRAGLESVGFRYKNCLVWVKNNHGSGDLRGNWAPQHEFVLFVTKGKGRPMFGKRRPNVFFRRLDKGKADFFPRVSNYRFDHGTTKPVELLRIIIQASTAPGEVVLDPYGGSGSTAEACLLEERHFILSEIDAEYCAMAQKRMEELLNHKS
jgi:site-specific DNA-methyltransferase (adenine-specific)